MRLVNINHYHLKPNERFFRIDRASPLGNPYILHSESQRDIVCDKYETHLMYIITRGYNGKSLKPSEITTYEYFKKIYNLVKAGEEVVLGCWCVPKRCHGETIVTFVKTLIENGFEL